MALIMMLALVVACLGAFALGACFWAQDRSCKAVAADRAERMGYRQR